MEISLYDGTSDSSLKLFSIKSGQLFVDGKKKEKLELTVAPITLTGVVYDGKKVVQEGAVSIVSLDKDGNELQGYWG
ncbi:hypothetical protein [Bacillus sp. 165]|uniref:hypothetical protein n=1 Tax=Bacillus sp. 165 TaxID=1529117 RepID=UPI001ADB4B91|nr:hypothetical protein [Bacillus sp. 165]MBO9130754.1 hypothetical protein [Bacillus sp. 165]